MSWQLTKAVERDGEIALIISDLALPAGTGQRTYTYRLGDMLDRRQAIQAARRDLDVLLAKLNRQVEETDITAEVVPATASAARARRPR